MEHSLIPAIDRIIMLIIALIILVVPVIAVVYFGMDDGDELYNDHELPDADGGLEAGREFLASEFVEVNEDE